MFLLVRSVTWKQQWDWGLIEINLLLIEIENWDSGVIKNIYYFIFLKIAAEMKFRGFPSYMTTKTTTRRRVRREIEKS